uniref:Ubiquitin-conjugating enzyme E2 Z n=1 Tax=viral metagenome TaxID=1070528 RepID=A0A6C0EUL8_9ZZZZ
MSIKKQLIVPSASSVPSSSKSLKRIMIDYKEIVNEPLDNICYYQDEDNIYKGFALIIGPKDTPYENGYYFFEFTFPESYPFNPPKVKFHTYDGFTRFNPNLYINGNVCLSILNTWEGEKWSSCQSIRSILLTLSTVLNDKPLLNEPGITQSHKDFDTYNNMLEYKNIEISILKYLEKTNLNYVFHPFYRKMVEHFLQSYEAIIKRLDKPTKKIQLSIYNSTSYNLEYLQLSNKVNMVYNELKV